MDLWKLLHILTYVIYFLPRECSYDGCLVPGTPPRLPLESSHGKGRYDRNDPCLMSPLCWYASHEPKQQSSSPLPSIHVCCPCRSVPVCVLALLMCHHLCVRGVLPCYAAWMWSARLIVRCVSIIYQSGYPVTTRKVWMTNQEGPMPDEPLCWYASHAPKQQSSTPPSTACMCVVLVVVCMYVCSLRLCVAICMCVRFAYVSPSVCPTCVAMLRCVNVECSANSKVCFDYLWS